MQISHQAPEIVESHSAAEESFNRRRRTVGLVLAPVMFVTIWVLPLALPVGRGEHVVRVRRVRVGREVEAPRGHVAERVLVVVEREPDLLQVVRTLHPRGGLADLLNRRQQQANENRNDGDDDEQFNQRESPRTQIMAHDDPCAC